MFDCCIMNPPYDKSLHLKIIAEILPHCDKVVNISPCRWLEDPLARYKSNSEYKKFEDKVSKKIEDLVIVEADVANELFDIDHTDLGIYTLGNGGYDYSKLSEMDSITRKIFEKCKGNKTIMDISTIEGYRGPHEGFFGVIGSHRHPDSRFISDDYGLFTTYRETCGNKLIFFNSENERKSCFNYLTSKLLRYYSSKIRTNQRIPWQFVPVIDFKEDCTDSYLKKYFGLTDEEYKNIFC